MDRRDGYYWKRESGEDKREFDELLKRDWQEFDLCSQAIRVSYDSVGGARGQIRTTCPSGLTFRRETKASLQGLQGRVRKLELDTFESAGSCQAKSTRLARQHQIEPERQ